MISKVRRFALAVLTIAAISTAAGNQAATAASVASTPGTETTMLPDFVCQTACSIGEVYCCILFPSVCQAGLCGLGYSTCYILCLFY